MNSIKAIRLSHIEQALDLSDETTEALSKLSADTLGILRDKIGEALKNARNGALNTARCPKHPAHRCHEFMPNTARPGAESGPRMCVHCHVLESV